ncbi:AhpC/TSA family protein [Chthonomonas calidirosea]|nr:AhpC/TSA family protein [Chthonomonas calidirosea]
MSFKMLSSKIAPARESIGTRSALRPTFLWAAVFAIVVALVLRHLHEQPALPPLDPLYGNSEDALPALITKLNGLPKEQQLPLLLQYVHSASAGLRYAAVDQLGNWKTPEAIAAVKQAFQDYDSEVRRRALYELPRMDFLKGQQLLAAALQDEDPWVREDAATQLALITERHKQKLDPSLVPALVQATEDPDINVSQMAMSALAHWLHRPWHVSMLAPQTLRQKMAAQWIRWWQTKRTHWPVSRQFVATGPVAPTLTVPCPDFTLRMIDGRTLTPRTQRGRITLLTFWGFNCGPCMAEQPDLNALYERYVGKPVDIIGVVVGNNTASEVRNYCRRNNVIPPQGMATPLLLRQFGCIEDVPVNVLIDPQGRICRIWQGAPRDPEPYSKVIDQLLTGVKGS